MLNWSDTAYKFTFGIGGLATAGALADLWKPALPTWLGVGIALFPLLIFVFIRPGELPPRLVRTAHVVASAWYVLTAMTLTIGFCANPGRLPDGWITYLVFGSIGLIPCAIVLGQAARGRYQRPNEQAPTPSRRRQKSAHFSDRA